jgi:transcription initiation factor TFIIE subunit alpha
MRFTTKKANELIEEAVGGDTIPIVNFLRGKKNISEFVIAEKTKTEIHIIRNALYRLHNANLVDYKRKKDSKKGYYISYWTFNQKALKDVSRRLQVNKLHKLQERLEKEEKNAGCFFLCSNACVRLDFEQGTVNEFKCPECGSLLTQQDNARTIEFLREQIKELSAKA